MTTIRVYEVEVAATPAEIELMPVIRALHLAGVEIPTEAMESYREAADFMLCWCMDMARRIVEERAAALGVTPDESAEELVGEEGASWD